MVRVCGNCRRSYSGGQECPECGPGHPLVEASDPKAHELLDERGWAGIRALYGARRAMLLFVWGVLFAPVMFLLIYRHSIKASLAVDKWIWFGIAVTLACAIFGGALWRGAKIARRTRRGYDLNE